MATRVSVLGLGIMGSAMACDAARTLYAVGWGRKIERSLALISSGVHAAKTPQNAALDADVVVTIVADANAVLSVMKDQGAFAA